MISAYTGTQVREAEKPFLDDTLGSGAGAVLMQRAAYGLANAVISGLRGRGQRLYGSSVAVLAGKGNNGGDGLFAAALLARRGMRTTAVLTAGAAHDAGLAAFRQAGGHAVALAADNVAELAGMAGAADVVIDAILGTGAQGGLRGPAAELAAALGRSRPGSRSPLVVACDIPSGVDADTGEAHAPVLAADMTVTFGAAKAGLLGGPRSGLRRPRAGNSDRNRRCAAMAGPATAGGRGPFRPPATPGAAGAQVLQGSAWGGRRLRRLSRRRGAGLQGRPGSRRRNGALPWAAGRCRPGPPVLSRGRVRRRHRGGYARSGLARWLRTG